MTHMVERIVPVDPVGAALGVGSGIVTLSLRQVGRSQSEDMSGARNPKPSRALAIRSHAGRSRTKAISGNPRRSRRSVAIRGNQWPTEAIRGHPRPSEAIRHVPRTIRRVDDREGVGQSAPPGAMPKTAGRTGVPDEGGNQRSDWRTRCDEHLHARQVGLADLRYGTIRGAIRGHQRHQSNFS